MPRNIEIKARVEDADALERSVAAIATQGPNTSTDVRTPAADSAGLREAEALMQALLSGAYVDLLAASAG